MARFQIGHAALGSNGDLTNGAPNFFAIEAGNESGKGRREPRFPIPVPQMNGSAGPGSGSIPHTVIRFTRR
jgi:hypothetical protein